MKYLIFLKGFEKCGAFKTIKKLFIKKCVNNFIYLLDSFVKSNTGC